MSIILTPQQIEDYNNGLPIQKPKEVKRIIPQPQTQVFLCEYNGLAASAWFSECVNWSWQNYLAFYTQKELQKEMQYIEARSYIRTYIANNFGEWKHDWEDSGEEKYYVFSKKGKWNSGFANYTNQPQPYPYLKSKEDADQLIRDCEPQLSILRDFWN